MSVTLFIMTQKGFEVLEALVSSGFKSSVDQVIVGRDKAIQKDFADEIIAMCVKEGISYHERKDQFTIESDFSVAIAWRWLINLDESKLIVLHDSILPKYRGFAPLVSYLVNKEPQIGVSLIFAEEEFDAGALIAQKSVSITYPIKINEAISKVSKLYVELVVDLISKIRNGESIVGQPQNDKEATFCLWREENDYLINWEDSAEDIARFVDAVGYPYSGASTYLPDGSMIRILEAEVVDDVEIMNRDSGKVLFVKNGLPIVVCGTGLLMITAAQNDGDGSCCLPLGKFRIRFTNQKLIAN